MLSRFSHRSENILPSGRRVSISHPRQVLTRDGILERVWGYDFMGDSNIIEVYIRYLRLKLEANQEKRLIQTVRGVGYVLRE